MSIKLRNLRQLIGRTLPPEFDPLLAFASSTREINLIISCAQVAKTMVEKAGEKMKTVALPLSPPAVDDSIRIRINSMGANMIGAIKCVREFTALGLKDAKDVCDRVRDGFSEQIGPMPVSKARKFMAEMAAIGCGTTLI